MTPLARGRVDWRPRSGLTRLDPRLEPTVLQESVTIYEDS